MTSGRELSGQKYSVNIDYIAMKCAVCCCYFLKHTTLFVTSYFKKR